MSDKTEDPTPHRLREARKQGQVPRSQDLVAAASMLAALGVLGFTLSWTGQLLHGLLRSCLSDLRHPPGLQRMVGLVCASSLPALAGSLVTALLVQLAYTGMTWSPLKLDPSRLNPLAALQRMFSRKLLVEAVRLSIKSLILGSLAYSYLKGQILPWCMGSHGPTALGDWGECLALVVKKLAGGYLALAVLDGLYQRWEWRQGLKMSKDEVKREYKQQNGDPMQKGRMRAMARKMARARSLEGVKKASVVITNPTHLAVALEYRLGEMKAPRVVAKGADEHALNIRRYARKLGVPIVEDKPLARALYPLDLNRYVPPELYRAVAEVLVAVTRAEESLR